MWYYLCMYRKDIVEYFRPFAERYKMSLTFIPDNVDGREAYVLHYRGKSILSVNTRQFYQVPKQARKRELLALLKRGLSGALDDGSAREQIYTTKRWGKTIIKDGR